ncbi:MAG: hypothetical protein ABSA83_11645 [Verrucomicrobiota bacterium]
MRSQSKAVALFIGALSALIFAQAADGADPDDTTTPVPAGTTNSAVAPVTRYGLFDWLEHRSAYTQEVFPEPFLVNDMALEDNELEFTWLHTKGPGQQNDTGSIEFQKGLGLLTLEVQVPYERAVAPDQTAHGIGNIELGARYPLYQFVSADRFVDATFGVAMEGGLPADSTVSRNAELDPEIFNDLRLGGRFTVQTVLGWSTLLDGGEDGGQQTFEYGLSCAYALPHRDLPLPGVEQFLPMFELAGERGLNKDEAGQNSLLGDIGFRVKFKPVGEVQANWGVAWVFPIDNGARAELHWGVITSLIFEF